ncbi:hypothetical protein EUX98_g1337 [Antrodiella citrinella]|uniref:Uracil-DNA glycosylase-like domain-containing protein n=1 Tax=Antrodiella citrinella TaxID=2447956 RepID=A0A4S4NA52_9APHY|nr:hypothetical protein EUX98_g1337 [Antrodiella citrinella]
MQVKQETTLEVSLSLPAEDSVTRSSRKRKVAVKSEDSPSIKKVKRGFAPPEQYAHLSFLTDHLQDGLDVMFCGVNPGCMSAKVGHHFASPTNHFWKCLHRSDRLLPPAEDHTLPASFNLGLTNLVARPSAEQAELSKADMINGVPVLLCKISEYRPRVVCFVGKGIWDVFVKEATKISAVTETAGSSSTPTSSSIPISPTDEKAKEEEADSLPTRATSRSTNKSKRIRKANNVFKWGIQPIKVVHPEGDYDIKESLFFVMPSTSGRVVSHQLPDKVKLFIALRENVAELQEGKINTEAMNSIPALSVLSFDA